MTKFKLVEMESIKFADHKTNVTEILKIVLGRVKYIVGNGENAGHHHFLLFPRWFQNASFSKLLMLGLCSNESVKILQTTDAVFQTMITISDWVESFRYMFYV